MNQSDRLHKNVPGDFYTTGWEDSGDCLSCEAPEDEAPTLLAPVGGSDLNFDTYFIRQPSTPEEVEAACRALESCCVGALRYGGTDIDIIDRLGNSPSKCDFLKTDRGTLISVRNEDGSYRREIRECTEMERAATSNAFQARIAGQLVKWHHSWAEPGARLKRPQEHGEFLPTSIDLRPSWVRRLIRSILGKTSRKHQ